ncbi:MAG: hypothetical protein ACW986_19545 [Promethearchaeota archaeon]
MTIEEYKCVICGKEFKPELKLIMTPDERLKATTVCSDTDCINIYRKRREERSSKQSTNEITQEIPRESLLRGIGSIICLIGGLFFFGSVGDLMRVLSGSSSLGVMPVIIFGVFTIIGALLGLKFHRAGRALCLIIGIISVPLMLILVSIGAPSITFVFGAIFTIVGSLVPIILKESKVETLSE